jgi:hypothetical protein
MKQFKNSQNQLNRTEAQARLSMLLGSSNNDFDSNKWLFEDNDGNVINIDFYDFEHMEKRYPKWSLVKKINWVLLSKQMWLSIASSTSVKSYKPRLDGIKLMWSMLAQHNLSSLTKAELPSLIEFLLTHSWRNGRTVKNRHIRSRANFTEVYRLEDWRLALSELEIHLIAYNIKPSATHKKLKILIPEVTNSALTYSDWCKGGSFNKLTLDHGQHYVKHCFDFFEQQYPLALALARTYRAAPKIAEELNYNQISVSQILSLILQGNSIKEIERRLPTWSAPIISNSHIKITRFFKAEYKSALSESSLLKDEKLESFITACGIQLSPPNIDRMRILIWGWLQRKDHVETQRLLAGFQDEVSWVVFKTQLKLFKDSYDGLNYSIPTESEYISLGLNPNRSKHSSISLPRQLINIVAKAGLTNIVALTGWRKSEFGFNSSSIMRTLNKDKLDQYSFPFRYQIDWYVYKTNGKVRLLREVTFGTILLVERLQKLLDTTNDEPCLYSVNESKKKIHDSRSAVNYGVRGLWEHFVRHYQGFKLIDDWKAWKKLKEASKNREILTEVEQNELERLLSKHSEDHWGNLSVDIHLLETWQKVRAEWPRIELFFHNTSGDKKDWLIKYLEGNLLPAWTSLLDTYLSNETKEWLRSLAKNDLKSLRVGRTVIDELIDNTIYPTPHSFRHMWAEAVYRRFDGDVGWLIRSQFKHISRTMWLAYIRDKDNRRGNQLVKSQVISSLVYNYLRRNGEGYAGQVNTRLRRLLRSTSVLSHSEQEELAEELAFVEIENIKANPWGYCLLMRRTRSKAKCAEMNEPIPHNASPDLCLGCIHNLMQTENVEWSLFHASSHLDALKNPAVPAIFKSSSYELVKNVTRHVRTLDADHEALHELDTVLANYKASRAA